MYISKKDLEFLVNVECYLFTNNLELHNEMWELTEKLIAQKKEYNKANWERIKAKRKTNKNYARNKKKDVLK